MPETKEKSQLVSISYSDLVRFAETTHSSSFTEKDRLLVLEKIGLAFGSGDDCLGILAVTDVPDLDQYRQTLLPLAQTLATLPTSDLEKVIDYKSGFQSGWSHGKEKVEGDKFDTGKGSFYANPLMDDITKDLKDQTVDKQIIEENPAFFAPNVWPTESIPAFESAFKDLGQLVVQVGRLLARPCDAYVKKTCGETYRSDKLFSVINESRFCKARLLHYFAMDTLTNDNDEKQESTSQDTDFSDWCGWHNDHGSLTGLVPAIFLDADGNQVNCPDNEAGLYIKSRSGSVVHASLPPGSLGFQIGETSQIHTGGVLQATPHAVRGVRSSTSPRITRESFAVFMEPDFFGDMDIHVAGKTVEDTQRREAEKHLPATVRTLRSRWKPGMNFGEFSNATFAAFY
mmetsp:Transcript_7459/g.10587  ORF Transcript_7459/g.10587 Transcript_7459/m.10587 type:complete len:400 (+) Transcript_7459:91-1290(+)